MQNRIFGEIDQNGETVPFTATEDDEIAAEPLRSTNDFALDAAGFDQ